MKSPAESLIDRYLETADDQKKTFVKEPKPQAGYPGVKVQASKEIDKLASGNPVKGELNKDVPPPRDYAPEY